MQTLFTAETARARLTWSGPRSVAPSRPLVVRSVSGDAIRIDGVETPALEVGFQEETDYPVLLQSLDGTPVALEHPDPVVTSRLVVSDEGRVVHGAVRFGSQAGRTAFQVWAGARVVLEVEASVLPTKMSEPMVTQMRSDVERVAAGLSVSALRPATLSSDLGDGDVSPPVWLATLRTSVSVLERSIREIERRPVLEVVRPVRDVRPSRIRRGSTETRRSVAREGFSAQRLPTRPATETRDTPAHRWLHARLSHLGSQLQELSGSEASRSPSARRERVLSDLEDVSSRLGDLTCSRLFSEVGARPPTGVPIVLRRHPAYASAFDALQSLRKGLAFRGSALDVATQDLSQLFETWSVLEVVRSFAHVLEVEAPARPFGIDVVGTDVRMRRGRSHAVALEGGRVRVEIVYEPRFPAPPALLAQRPDVLITIRRGLEVERVVFDAKYRRDDSAAYRRRYGAAGPPEDALGTLHRYRDAIVEAPPIRLAAALFPGEANEAFFGSRLWSSLSDLGVGAVPLRPGSLGALDRLTHSLVE